MGTRGREGGGLLSDTTADVAAGGEEEAEGSVVAIEQRERATVRERGAGEEVESGGQKAQDGQRAEVIVMEM